MPIAVPDAHVPEPTTAMHGNRMSEGSSTVSLQTGETCRADRCQRDVSGVGGGCVQLSDLLVGTPTL